ncbi:hypothetical protein C9022_27150, partial (plasmid) [Escherichia coli]
LRGTRLHTLCQIYSLLMITKNQDTRGNAVSQTALHVVAAGPCPLFCPVPFTCLSPCRRGLIQPQPSPPVQG